MLSKRILQKREHFLPEVLTFFELCYACQQGRIPLLRKRCLRPTLPTEPAVAR